MSKLEEESRELRKIQDKLLEEIREFKMAQDKLASILYKLTPPIEEEALDVVRRRLKDELGLDIKLDKIIVNDREINVYGSSADLCVIGDAIVKLKEEDVKEFEEKIKFLREVKPELIKSKMIKVIYVDYAFPRAVDLAKEYGIWILNWKGDITPRKIHS
jgi:hypothetical protein